MLYEPHLVLDDQRKAHVSRGRTGAVIGRVVNYASRPEHMLMSHVGHPRCPKNVEEVLTCDDNEVRVINQVTLQPG
jgi:hypothetical protein